MSCLLQFLSRALEPADRDAVLRDLAESGASGVSAFFDVLGLIARRQLAVWKDWRPWFALAGVVRVSGVYMSRTFSALNIGIFEQLTAWRRFHVHYNTGVNGFGEDVVYMVCLATAIFCWSLANGFVLRRFSGWAALFCCVVLYPLLLAVKFRMLGGLGLWTVLFVIPAVPGTTGKVPGMALIVVIVTLLAASMGARHHHALVSWPVLFLLKPSLRRG